MQCMGLSALPMLFQYYTSCSSSLNTVDLHFFVRPKIKTLFKGCNYINNYIITTLEHYIITQHYTLQQ